MSANSSPRPPICHALRATPYTTTPRYDQPGIVVPPEPAARRPALRNVVIPLRPHLGGGGVAPQEAGRINSIPPDVFGGNIDNWRFGPGAAMYYPVFHPGALCYLGSVAADFAVTQVVDMRQGVHGMIAKSLFLPT